MATLAAVALKRVLGTTSSASALKVGRHFSELASVLGASCRAFAASSETSLPSSTRGTVYYQSDSVPTSLLSTGLVGTRRDLLGSDAEFFGTDPRAHEVEILNGRGMNVTLDKNGFSLVPHAWRHIDYYNNDEVVNQYYRECEALLCHTLGASKALAFDHNLRAKSKKLAGEQLKGGSAVQEPLLTYGIHNDYTATSAPSRIRQLTEPPRENDTLRSRGGPGIDPSEVDRLLAGRWMFVNVWRNITEHPVERFPLAACDAASVDLKDLVVFEIRYADRVGENYFARYSSNHRWFYFPRITRDEVILLKCWDSRGQDFIDPKVRLAAMGQEAPTVVPATFALHTAFNDVATRSDAPDRESIEVRLMVFFD